MDRFGITMNNQLVLIVYILVSRRPEWVQSVHGDHGDFKIVRLRCPRDDFIVNIGADLYVRYVRSRIFLPRSLRPRQRF